MDEPLPYTVPHITIEYSDHMLKIQLSGIVNSEKFSEILDKLEKSFSTISGCSIDVQTALPEAALGLRNGGLWLSFC